MASARREGSLTTSRLDQLADGNSSMIGDALRVLWARSAISSFPSRNRQRPDVQFTSQFGLGDAALGAILLEGV